MYNNAMNLKIIDMDLKALTAFTIHVGEYGRPAKCFAEVRSLGVTCRGESQAKVLWKVTARVLRIMSRRMAQGMVVPDMLEDLFGTVPRTIDGLGQCLSSLASLMATDQSKRIARIARRAPPALPD